MNTQPEKLYITRKTLLYRTGVEYGDYCINHVQGCAHGCLYPCYAMMMAKRFGRVSSYEDWLKPRLVENALELLKSELPGLKSKIKSVHFCFTTDPFMYGYEEITAVTLQLIEELSRNNISYTALTKGILPQELADLGPCAQVGISLVSLDEDFRQRMEPFSAPAQERLDSLYGLYRRGMKTWVSIEPYPTPNIIDQDLYEILESVAFVDKIVFGRLNYNKLVNRYADRDDFYNRLSRQVIDFCRQRDIEWHIKAGTLKENLDAGEIGL